MKVSSFLLTDTAVKLDPERTNNGNDVDIEKGRELGSSMGTHPLQYCMGGAGILS
jgi:hypothetical protein